MIGFYVGLACSASAGIFIGMGVWADTAAKSSMCFAIAGALTFSALALLATAIARPVRSVE